MRSVWRLATSRLSARPSRTALVIAAVALSAALITVVSSAMASLNAAIRARLNATVGAADVVLKPASSTDPLPPGALARVESWPGVAVASPARTEAITLRLTTGALVERGGAWVREGIQLDVVPVAHGVDFARWNRVRPLELLAGRFPEAQGEIVIDGLLAERMTHEYQSEDRGSGRYGLSIGTAVYGSEAIELPERADSAEEASALNARVGVRVGDTLEVVRTGGALDLLRRLGGPAPPLTVVGVVRQPPLGGRPQVYMSLDTLAAVLGGRERLSEIEIVLAPGTDPEAFAATYRAGVPEGFVLETTARVTANVEKNLASSQLGLVLATVLAFLTASFIIFTGLTIDAAEQQRQLAMLRCIGARRSQLAGTQLLVGALIGVAGAAGGIPLGLGIAGAIIGYFREYVPEGTLVSPLGLVLASSGSVFAGVVGAAWPAWRAARTSPLKALSARARPPGPAVIAASLLVAVIGLGVHLLTFLVPRDAQVMFWGYATIGLPAIFVGYFFLSVPVISLVTRLLGPPLVAALGVPRGVVERLVGATPFRYGFTAGAMMAGLALMVGLWTQGGALLRDWLGKLKFPDAFVSGLSIPPEAQARLDSLPFVEGTCAITLHPVETDAFGVRALQQYHTMFVAFEPEPFFEMATLTWVEGDPEVAKRRLEEGGAVIVAREFMVAQGLGVGDTFACREGEKELEFEIVGVVTSPGLEIVSKFFDIGAEYTHQALHAVFGSRADLKKKLGSSAINLIQIELDEGVRDEVAIDTIWRELAPYGVLDAGSGRQILSEIIEFMRAMLLATSAVAVINMLIASLGVANVIVSSVEQRRFELGVLRAVGGQRGMLARMIAAEAVLIAITAGILGTLMGMQLSFAAQNLHRALLGLVWRLRPPPLPIAVGCAIVLLICLLASVPAVLRLNRLRPRELLSTRG
ncbi:MAG TPA: FtsX-like permease family protein [Phycisphaerales bacterium]|nr:FtsX-like permease family protein [Phycisphaerales bacterium]